MNKSDIDAEYQRLGYSIGWRFLMSPERTLQSATIALVTLNPGGDRPNGTDWSQEGGSGYVIEAWPGKTRGADKLQVQVQRMCRLLGVDPKEVLSGYFVPFRSPNWESLSRRDEAIDFGRRLWLWAFSNCQPKLILCVGKAVVAPEIARLIGAKLDGTLPTGWGDYTFDRYTNDKGQVVLGMPHLSRFTLFGKPARDRAFKMAVGGN